MTREKHDYRAMLADLQAHPNEERVVWRRPFTEVTRRQAVSIASSLEYWIKYPHRGDNGKDLCRKLGCTPRHVGEGDTRSHLDRAADEMQVIGRWLDSPPKVEVLRRPMTAEDVLFVLNELEPVDLPSWTFCVLTDAPGGNFSPFERGEILVLDEHRTEVGGGRRPAKSDVAENDFATLAEALACREQVLAGTWPRSFGED